MGINYRQYRVDQISSSHADHGAHAVTPPRLSRGGVRVRLIYLLAMVDLLGVYLDWHKMFNNRKYPHLMFIAKPHVICKCYQTPAQYAGQELATSHTIKLLRAPSIHSSHRSEGG